MRFRRTPYVLRLAAIWAVTVAILCYVWPMEPRFSIPDGNRIHLIGITPDSRYLVASTLRGMTADEDFQDEGVFSGPIQVWDLHSGERRRIKLPQQTDSGERVPTNHGIDAMVDRERWALSIPSVPFEGNHFRLIQTNRLGKRLAVDVDVDQAVSGETKLPDVQSPLNSANTLTSPTGRWIVDVHKEEPAEGSMKETLRLIDATTGLIRREFAPSLSYAVCFSDDETLLAVSEDFDETGTTTIWRLEPFELMRTIHFSTACMRFSPGNRFFAAVVFEKVVVIDIATGATANEFPSNAVQVASLRFSSDERDLYGYAYLRSGTSGGATNHCLISDVQHWNLEAGVQVSNWTPAVDFNDPNLCQNGSDDQTTPFVLQDDKQLFDIRTGRTTLEIPDGTTVEATVPEKNLGILCRRHVSKLHFLAGNFVVGTLSSFKIPIPDLLWPNLDRSQLVVCDMSSARIRAVLPSDEYLIDSRSLFLSPDAQTMVTKSNWSSPVIRVWDLRTPKPWLKLIAWSIVVPLCILVWQWTLGFVQGNRMSPRITRIDANEIRI